MNKALIVMASALFAAACGAATSTSPSPSSSTTSMAGTWAGTASDSSSTMGTGSMMGQADMGTMTWQLTESGSTVTGSMSFSGSGMMGRTPGIFKGTMSGDDITFTMEMPAGSMMSAACQSTATGTGHVNRTTMIMTGTYTGTNGCTGMYTGGQTSMTHR